MHRLYLSALVVFLSLTLSKGENTTTTSITSEEVTEVLSSTVKTNTTNDTNIDTDSRQAKLDERQYSSGSGGYGSVQVATSNDKYPSYSDYKPSSDVGYKPSYGGIYKPTYQTSSSSGNYKPYKPNGGQSSYQNYGGGKPNYQGSGGGSYQGSGGNYQGSGGSYQGSGGSYQGSGGSYQGSGGSYQGSGGSYQGNGGGYQGNGGSYQGNGGSYQGSGGSYQQGSGSGSWQSQNSKPSYTNNNKQWTQQSSNHNQQVANLNECSGQQACNAIFLRMNYTHRLCSCPSSNGKQGRCSESRNAYDGYTMELATRPIKRKTPMTLLKTCQPLNTLRACRNPKDWSLLALQNVRTGKAQYLVTCRCPNWASLEGPVAHETPAYADIPGIRVYGMLCWSGSRGSRFQAKDPAPDFPWDIVIKFVKSGRLN